MLYEGEARKLVSDLLTLNWKEGMVSRKKATWSYVKFRGRIPPNPRNFLYVVRGRLGGWLFPRSRDELLKYGSILQEDDNSYVFVSYPAGAPFRRTGVRAFHEARSTRATRFDGNKTRLPI
jgi:hypothetical protein